jgi:hypothetical protein
MFHGGKLAPIRSGPLFLRFLRRHNGGPVDARSPLVPRVQAHPAFPRPIRALRERLH